LSWLVDVEFKRSSVEGTGVFASSAITAGSKVWQYDRSMRICSKLQLALLPPGELRFALHAGYLHKPSGKFLYYRDGMEYMNHAFGSMANVGSSSWPERVEEDHTVALRDIEAGEELLEDYTFCLDGGLAPDHWMRPLYLAHNPEHYSFLLGLHEFAQAA
jgi:hypothetical protein